MQLDELQFGEMPHFFNTPHAFKKIGEMQFGEMPHTLIILKNFFFLNIFINKGLEILLILILRIRNIININNESLYIE